MGQFKFLLETNEMGERLHKKFDEAEALEAVRFLTTSTF